MLYNQKFFKKSLFKGISLEGLGTKSNSREFQITLWVGWLVDGFMEYEPLWNFCAKSCLNIYNLEKWWIWQDDKNKWKSG